MIHAEIWERASGHGRDYRHKAAGFNGSAAPAWIIMYFYIDLIKYRLKSIAMDSFAAIADPTRRRIIELLGHGRLAAGDIAARFESSAPAISQHLKALREARLVRVEVQGQRRIYSLDPDGLGEMDEWFQQVRRYWSGRLDALERELRKPETTQDEPRDKRSKP